MTPTKHTGTTYKAIAVRWVDLWTAEPGSLAWHIGRFKTMPAPLDWGWATD